MDSPRSHLLEGGGSLLRQRSAPSLGLTEGLSDAAEEREGGPRRSRMGSLNESPRSQHNRYHVNVPNGNGNGAWRGGIPSTSASFSGRSSRKGEKEKGGDVPSGPPSRENSTERPIPPGGNNSTSASFRSTMGSNSMSSASIRRLPSSLKHMIRNFHFPAKGENNASGGGNSPNKDRGDLAEGEEGEDEEENASFNNNNNLDASPSNGGGVPEGARRDERGNSTSSASKLEGGGEMQYTPDQLNRILDRGIRYFNLSPQKGLLYLQKARVLNRRKIAEFLKNTPGLNKEQIGSVLGSDDVVLRRYIELFDFSGYWTAVEGGGEANHHPPNGNSSGHDATTTTTTTTARASGSADGSSHGGGDPSLKDRLSTTTTTVGGSADLSQASRPLPSQAISLTEALRALLRCFKPPGEAQKIDRILAVFAEKFVRDCPYDRHDPWGGDKSVTFSGVMAEETIAEQQEEEEKEETRSRPSTEVISPQPASAREKSAPNAPPQEESKMMKKKVPMSVDAAHTLAFAVILLNVDLHNPNNAKKMSQDQFVRNCVASLGSGLEECIMEADLESVYESVAMKEIRHVVDREDVAGNLFTNPDMTGYLDMKGFNVRDALPGFISRRWRKMWFILSSNSLFFFRKATDVDFLGFIPLENISVFFLDHTNAHSPTAAAAAAAAAGSTTTNADIGNNLTINVNETVERRAPPELGSSTFSASSSQRNPSRPSVLRRALSSPPAPIRRLLSLNSGYAAVDQRRCFCLCPNDPRLLVKAARVGKRRAAVREQYRWIKLKARTRQEADEWVRKLNQVGISSQFLIRTGVSLVSPSSSASSLLHAHHTGSSTANSLFASARARLDRFLFFSPRGKNNNNILGNSNNGGGSTFFGGFGNNNNGGPVAGTATSATAPGVGSGGSFGNLAKGRLMTGRKSRDEDDDGEGSAVFSSTLISSPVNGQNGGEEEESTATAIARDGGAGGPDAAAGILVTV